MTSWAQLGRRLLTVWLPIGVVSAVVTYAAYRGIRRQRSNAGCEENLLSIYDKLREYSLDHGSLPAISFFPDDVYTDPDSLYTVLVPYGILAEECVCPALARHLGDLGITYVWNARLSGIRWEELGPGAWLLVEINALSRNLPPPHGGHYHILYADGRVESSIYPPPGL